MPTLYDTNKFCGSCSYVTGRDACQFQTRKQAFEHNQCDWSMISGVGARPRTRETLAIWDPGQGEYVTVKRSDEAAVREAIRRNLKTKPSN